MLNGNSVTLVGFDNCHITDEYVGWLNDGEVNRYLHTGRTPFYKQATPTVGGDETNFKFAIIYKDEGKYIGTISLHNIDWIVRKAEIGYMIGDKNYWGRGIATEIVGLITDYGFNRLNLNKLYAGVISGNTGSSKALLKNGYVEYATIPQEYYLNGKFLDCAMFYKLQEWHLALG